MCLAILVDKDGGNVFSAKGLQTAIDLDETIRNVISTLDGVQYTDICSRWKGNCLDNSLLEAYRSNSQDFDTFDLTYPLHKTSYFLGSTLGGVEPDSKNSVHVQKAKAIRLSYHVKYKTAKDKTDADQWMETYLEEIQAMDIPGFRVELATSGSLGWELEKSSKEIIPLFSITYTLLITFAVVSCLTIDWVRSKPWLAMAGTLTAGLSVVSAFGLMLACGVEFTSQVATMPFLAIGVGLDDMFVMVASWRQTRVKDPLEDRMGAAMKEAALSITITSITDALAFIIGAVSVFPSIRIFCLYTGTCIIFCYFYSITFFAACMAIDGKRKGDNRHAMVPCIKVKAKEDAEDRSWWYRIWCAGGSKPRNSDGVTDHLAMNLFKEHIGPFMMKIPSKVIVIVSYLVYLMVAIWGCTQLREGLQLQNLANDDSYLVDFYKEDATYFKRYGFQVTVLVMSQMDYSEVSTQDLLNRTL